MLKMAWFFGFFLFCFLGLTGAGQENIQFLELYATIPAVHQKTPHLGRSFAVSVSDEELNGVSSSVLKAETWLRTHVLAHFPATKITTIVVGGDAVCKQSQDHNLGLVLPSLKNLYHSLTRWGLEKDIKVSAAFTSSCTNHPNSVLSRDGLAEEVTIPLLEFIRRTNSTYSIYVPPNISPLSNEVASIVSSHADFVRKFGFFVIDKINLIITNPKHQKPNRKLSTIDPVPAKPSPLPETAQPPLHSSVGFSAPANIARNPFPPLAQVAATPPLSFPHASPPEMYHSFAPEEPPLGGTAAAPYGYSFPPCNPAGAWAPAPATVEQQLWCVAKPSVPAETLQEAIDYACGEGGADCSEIGPQGRCFYPDTVVAHASYAFNSYWQKTKRNGGTCSFEGTAMLINADPSFLHCRFALS